MRGAVHVTSSAVDGAVADGDAPGAVGASGGSSTSVTPMVTSMVWSIAVSGSSFSSLPSVAFTVTSNEIVPDS